MTDTAKIAIDTLRAKAQELAEDRDEVRRKLLEAAARNAQIERDLAGCIAGARALGQDIEFSSPITISPQKQPFLNQLHQWSMQIASLYPQLKTELGIKDDSTDGTDIDESRPEMPRIADIILERLQAAGEDGAKAADIRRHIFRTYETDMHEKTVGMTLNRMQAAGQVRRDGRTWFLASASTLAASDTAKSSESLK